MYNARVIFPTTPLYWLLIFSPCFPPLLYLLSFIYEYIIFFFDTLADTIFRRSKNSHHKVHRHLLTITYFTLRVLHGLMLVTIYALSHTAQHITEQFLNFSATLYSALLFVKTDSIFKNMAISFLLQLIYVMFFIYLLQCLITA